MAIDGLGGQMEHRYWIFIIILALPHPHRRQLSAGITALLLFTILVFSILLAMAFLYPLTHVRYISKVWYIIRVLSPLAGNRALGTGPNISKSLDLTSRLLGWLGDCSCYRVRHLV